MTPNEGHSLFRTHDASQALMVALSAERRAIIRSALAVRIIAVGLNRYSVMVLGIVRLSWRLIVELWALAGRAQHGERSEKGWDEARAGRVWRSESGAAHTAPRKRRSPPVESFGPTRHGGPRGCCGVGNPSADSTVSMWEPHASQRSMSRPSRARKVATVTVLA